MIPFNSTINDFRDRFRGRLSPVPEEATETVAHPEVQPQKPEAAAAVTPVTGGKLGKGAVVRFKTDEERGQHALGIAGTFRTLRAYRIKTAPEVEEERQKDIAAGRFHDDGGEPILYGNYSRDLKECNHLVVYQVNGVSTRYGWNPHWGKPVHVVDTTTGWEYHVNRQDLIVIS